MNKPGQLHGPLLHIHFLHARLPTALVARPLPQFANTRRRLLAGYSERVS